MTFSYRLRAYPRPWPGMDVTGQNFKTEVETVVLPQVLNITGNTIANSMANGNNAFLKCMLISQNITRMSKDAGGQ